MKAATLEPIETRSSPCEDCNHTGRCAECGGTGRVEGGACICDDGKCIHCEGTGRHADFYYRGRKISSIVYEWKLFLEGGAGLLGLGIFLVLAWLLAPGMLKMDIYPLPTGIAFAISGALLVCYAFRLRRLLKLVQEARRAYYMLPEGL